MTSLVSQLNHQRQPADLPATEKPVRTATVDGTSTSAATPSPTSKKENLKIVIRHLPPDMEASFFYGLVQPWINNDSTNETYFVPGRVSKKKNKKPIDTRVYIYMRNAEYLQKFYVAFNKEILPDFEGDVKPVLEISPNQGKLKPAKPSNIANTIQEDPEFQQFIKDIQALELKKEGQQAKEAEEAKKEAVPKTDKVVAVAGTGPLLGVPAKEESLPVEQPKAPTPASQQESEPTKKETEKPKKTKKKKEKSKDIGDKKESTDGKKTRGNKQPQSKSKEEAVVKKETTPDKEKKKNNKKARVNREAVPELSSKDTKPKLGSGNTKESISKTAAASPSKNSPSVKTGNLHTEPGKYTAKSGLSGKSTPKTTDSGRSTPKHADSGRSTPKPMETGKATTESNDARKTSKFGDSGKSMSRKVNESTKSTSKKGPKNPVDRSNTSTANEDADFIDNLLGESVKKIISEDNEKLPSKPKYEGKGNKNKKNKTNESTAPVAATGSSADGSYLVPKGPAASKPAKNNNRKKKPFNSSPGQATPVSAQTSEASPLTSVPKGPRSVIEGSDTKKPRPSRRSKPKPTRKPSEEKPNSGSSSSNSSKSVPTGPRSAA